MCPLCVTSLALMSTGATAAGGLAAVVMKRFGSRKRANIEFEKPERKDESMRQLAQPLGTVCSSSTEPQA